jgi:hypothetical protein
MSNVIYDCNYFRGLGAKCCVSCHNDVEDGLELCETNWNGQAVFVCCKIYEWIVTLTSEQRAVKIFMERGEPYSAACGCMGAQDNEPKCPCAMRWMVSFDGQYYEISKESTECGYNYVATKYVVPVMVSLDECVPLSLSERLAAFKQNRK